MSITNRRRAIHIAGRSNDKKTVKYNNNSLHLHSLIRSSFRFRDVMFLKNAFFDLCPCIFSGRRLSGANNPNDKDRNNKGMCIFFPN